MNRILGTIRGRAGRVGLVAGVITATVVALALPAGANTGHAYASQDCDGWWAKVTLDNNVTSDHYVEVTTTIPGTSGIVDGNYDTTGNSGPKVIWSASGDEPTHGTVTLTILKPNKTFDTGDSATLHKVEGCNDSTSTTESTMTSTTTTTTPPSSTSTSTTGPSVPGPTETSTSTSTSTTPTTQAPATTQDIVSPSTTSTSVPGTVGTQGNTISTTSTSTTIVPGGISQQQLPRTGSGALFPALFGGSCLAGGVALALRHRRTIWTMRK